ncbi:MAG: (Fe-S)-binding protein [Candidatus Neomarinimicrobiota bacterium]
MEPDIVSNPLAQVFGDEEKRQLWECTHCGFCLPACPTYTLNGMEVDSPRGRLYMMEAAMNDRIPMTAPFFEHINFCLSCLACETACPSGVEFGHLMEKTRATVMHYEPRSRVSRWMTSFLLTQVVPSNYALSVLTKLLAIYQRTGAQWLVRQTPLHRLLSRRLQILESSTPAAPLRSFSGGKRRVFHSRGEKRGEVALFTGCVMNHLFPDVHLSTIRLLTWHGYDVVVPGGQTCCGALHVHAGDSETAHRLAGTNLSVFSGATVDTIIVNAAGCGAHLKNYTRFPGHNNAASFAGKIKDLSEFLAGVDLVLPGNSMDMSVVYDEACHLVHGQGISEEPRKLLETLPGVTVLPLKEADRCCGSAGSYTLTQTDASLELLERKMDFIEAASPDAVVTANPGCQIQLEWGIRRRHLKTSVLHFASLLDRAYWNDSGYL